MHPDLSNILSNSREPLSSEQLMAYLKGELSHTEARMVEEQLTEEGMDSDAFDGLHNIDGSRLSTLQYELAKNLKNRLGTQKAARRARQRPDLKWPIIITALVVLLALVAWVMVLYLQGDL